jgi:hypothetical protein
MKKLILIILVLINFNTTSIKLPEYDKTTISDTIIHNWYIDSIFIIKFDTLNIYIAFGKSIGYADINYNTNLIFKSNE